jgi:hypothetical protein
MVTEAELSSLLKEQGWYLVMLRKYKTRYAYAKKRAGKRVLTRYLKTESKLSELTVSDVLKRIQA